MRTLWKVAGIALATTLLPAWSECSPAAAADPFGRVERGPVVEPPPQVFVNPYAAPAPARLPDMRLAALGQVVRVDNLGNAYRATPAGELPAGYGQVARAVAPATLAAHPAARPIGPAASANAPAALTHDRAVVPAAYGTPQRGAAAAVDDGGLNPLRRADASADRSANPLR